jgi:ADP-L-glycero-D-manno-heptose 6-epimerase
MIVVTGAAGFIGSNIVAELNAQGETEIVAVDVRADVTDYLRRLHTREFVSRDLLPAWLAQHGKQVRAVLHMGACSDTTNSNREYMMRNNFEYTRSLWHACVEHGARFIYASSAATYGGGSMGYDDRCDPHSLRPLNIYGESKHLFDLWALEQQSTPNGWAGLKFFNVYGPNEQHKGRMASVAYQAFQQIKSNGVVKLFASDRAGVEDGAQMRDFIYVKDAVAAVLYFMTAPREKADALFNVGTGKARCYSDLAAAVFTALKMPANIQYIPLPEDLKGRYQYFTEARIEKLRAAGFSRPFYALEDGVADYMKHLADGPFILEHVNAR